MSRVLVLMAGLPRSGKTTAALATGQPIVCPDAIRYALHGQRFFGPAEPFVWAAAYLMAEALFLAGHDTVVIDATNTTAKRRGPWEDLANRLGAKVELRVMDASPATCRQRAALDGVPAVLLPVIDRMVAQWDLPRPPSWESAK